MQRLRWFHGEGGRLLRNISWLGAASLLVKPVWLLFLVALCPRYLGVAGFGAFTAALTIAAIVTAFSDLGMSHLTLRDVARDRRQAALYLTNLLGARVGILVLGAGGLVLVELLGKGGDVGLMMAAYVYQAIVAVLNYLRHNFRAYEDLRLEAISTVVEKGAAMVGGSAVLLRGGTATEVLVAMAGGVGLVLLAHVVWFSTRLVRAEWSLLSASFLRRAFRQMLVFGLADLLMVVYLRIDIVMIDAFLSDTAVGQYGQPYRLLEALSIVPYIVAQSALYPRLCVLHADEDYAQFRRRLRQGAWGLLAVGIAVAGLLAVAGPSLIQLLVDDPAFDASGMVLQLLVWTFPLTCIKDLFYVAFFAMNRQRVSVRVLGAALVLNGVLNSIAIPVFGILGAAGATVLTELVIVCTFLWVYLRGVALPHADREHRAPASTGLPLTRTKP